MTCEEEMEEDSKREGQRHTDRLGKLTVIFSSERERERAWLR